MKALKKTTLGGLVTPHYHIVYADSDKGYGVVAQAEGHAHPIQWVPPQPEIPEQPEQQDPQTGEIIPAQPGQPATPGYWAIGPAPDGHTHEGLEDYKIKSKGKTEKDEEIIDDVLILLREAHQLEGESIEKGLEAEEFIGGKQWDDAMKSQLEAQGRAALCINFTAKYVNEILGHEIQNRTDIRYLPLEDGDQKVADILNIVSKHITNQCFYDREKSKVFRDEVVPGRGVFNIFVDVSRDIRGEIKIERYPWKNVRFGPHEKEDLADCEYVIKDKMFSLGKIKQLWPKKAEEVEKAYHDITALAEFGKLREGDPHDGYRTPDRTFPMMVGDVKMVDIARKEFRVVECWRKVYVEHVVATNPDHDCYFNVYGWEPKDQDAIATIPGFSLVKKPGHKMRITKLAGGVVLSDEPIANLPVDDFFVVPVYCNKNGNKFWGKVEDVKDAQREVNKRHSQAIDIGNRMASYGWFYDSNTFPDNQAEAFKTRGAVPGFYQEVNDVGRVPVKVEGTKFPTEIVQLMELGARFISELMNISPEPRGANTSAQAMLQEEKQKLRGNEFLFDSMSFAQMKIGRLLIKLIQKYYTPDRIARLVINAAQRNPQTIGGQPASSFTEEDIIAILETADLDQYDVEIAEAPNSPSARLTTSAILSDLMQRGVQVPPTVYIKMADIPEQQKQEILQDIQAQQESMAAAEKEKYRGEMGKTLLAQGIIPPDIAQEFGLQNSSQGLPEGGQDFQNTQTNGGLAEVM